MKPSYPRRLQIVVLAAGFSGRFGRPKTLARLHGVSLLRRTLQLASSLGTARISVVVPRNAARYRVEAAGIKVRWAVNSRRRRACRVPCASVLQRRATPLPSC